MSRNWFEDPQTILKIQDIPSPIDLRIMAVAVEWESSALTKRPWRTEFFTKFASVITSASNPVYRILELGSGPGFLAENLIRALPSVSYVALDFSPAIHQLAIRRLGTLAPRVQFV